MILYRANSGATGTSTAPLPVKPAGSQPGDIHVLALLVDSAAATITPPAGWTLIRSDADATKGNQTALFWAREDGSAFAAFTISGGAVYWGAQIATYSGCRQGTTPIATSAGQVNAASANVPAPSITTTIDNCMALYVGSDDYGGGVTPPAGYTQRRASPFDAQIAEKLITPAGTTGTVTGTHTSNRSNGQHLALLPDDTIIIVAGPPADRLSVAITRADQTVARWGPDEWQAQNIPQAMSFSTSVPGGFKDATITLPRRVDLDYPDLNLYDTITILGPGAKVAWEGRVVQLPREHGDSFSIAVGAVGWAAHLRDNPGFSMVYVDRDLSHWEAPSVQRRINLAAVNTGLQDFAVQADDATGKPALITRIQGPAWGATGLPDCEALYDAGAGNALGSIYHAWTKGANVNAADVNWAWGALLATDDTLASVDSSGNLRAAGPGTGTVTATTATRRYAALQLYFAIAGGTSNMPYDIFWTCLAAYGNHGLTKYGTEDATNAKGLLASDIIRHAVRSAAPLLSAELSTTAGGKIDPTSFPIPQAEFRDRTTAEDVITRINAYHLWEWFVWENKAFHYRAPSPTRLCWEARLDQGARISAEGDQADDVYNGVIVSYTSPNGSKRTAGPPGSGCDVTSASLADTSASNPVNAHGIPRRWATLDLAPVTTDAGATQLGYVWLLEHAAPQRRGTLTLTGTCRHPTAGDVPGWNVRAGDYIRIADHPADVPRRIIETRWDHEAAALTLSLDNTVYKLEAMLERLGVTLTGVI